MKLACPKAFVMAAVLAASVHAQSTLTQTVSNAMTAGNSAACTSGTPPNQTTQETSYYRSFDLAQLPGSINVVSVTFGVESCTTTAPAGFPMQLRLYASPIIPPTLASLFLLATDSFNLAPTTQTLITRPITASFSPSDKLVVEVYSPTSANGAFIIGSNSGGQIAPGYMRSPACGLTQPTNVANIGYPNMHMIINVSYVGLNPSLSIGQNPVSHDLTVSALGPGGSVFLVYSFDPANGTSPGTGIWGGLHIGIYDLIDQLNLGLSMNPIWSGALVPNQYTFTLPAGTVVSLAGVSIWGIAYVQGPTTGFSNVDPHTFL